MRDIAARAGVSTGNAYYYFGSKEELVQAVLLSGRQASFSDVVANTLGALLGAVIGKLVFRPHRR